MSAADAFDLDGDDRRLGIVLVHGFTSTPWEMHFLGTKLAAERIGAHGIVLPGHAGTAADLDATTWRDWAGAVEAAVERARARYERVAIVGQSLGGLLALHTAAQRTDLAFVASLAAPLWLEGVGKVAARWAHRLGIRELPKLGGSDVRDPRAKAENPCLPTIPTKALASLCDFMPRVDELLPRVAPPVLVMHAWNDHTAPVACARRIADRVPHVRLRILPRSYHLISVDVEREIVAAEVIAFARKATSS